MLQTQLRKAFTMLELIFVIVILGIVASIGSTIIAQTFESYIMQRAVHSASIKTELAINQLANRLTYYIKPSLLARRRGTTDFDPSNVLPLSDVLPDNNTHTILQWIGYDNDGFSARLNTPSWSGVCDLSASDFNTLVTPASRLQNSTATFPSEATILGNIAPNAGRPAVKFLSPNYRPGQAYNSICMHQTTSANSCMFPASITGDNTLNFTGWGDRNAGEMIYSEFYQLAASAYSVVPTPPAALPGTGVFVSDLFLYYDYQPWEGENYLTRDIPNQLIAHNVSVFRFRQEGDTIRLKLCTVEQVGDTETISICKEKAVLR